MRLHHHTLVSLSISGLLYMAFNSIGLAISSFITGVFIDIDHFADVIREHGRKVTVNEFFRICHNGQFNKIILFFHGWEWLVMLGMAGWITGWNPWICGAMIGITHHLILDTIYNSSNFCTYSILWRWKQGFVFDSTFSRLKNDKYAYRKELTRSNN